MLSRRRFVSLTFGASALGTSALWAFQKSKNTTPQIKWQKRSAEKIFDLPPGFTCRVIDQVGRTMDDGLKVPSRPDGMGCFSFGSDVVLMRNHELTVREGTPRENPVNTDFAYDAQEIGGVSRIVLDGSSFEVKYRNMVLTGTARNCAGGKSPWGWLTCEETVAEGHGYVFACDPAADSLRKANRIVPYGRFNHEAAVVDPQTMIAYLTEDQVSGCFYRFLPDTVETPFKGKLQALKLKAMDNFPTSERCAVGELMAVEWVDVADPDPREDSVRFQAQAKGAAVVTRGEGIAMHQGDVYFCSTSGGPKKGGQIFRLIPGRNSAADKLQLMAQSDDRGKLDMPDNIFVTSKGHVFMAEDGDSDQFIRILKADGKVIDFARNAKSSSEIAGVCFDPTERVLFCNLQRDGLTVAITGPFDTI